MINPHPNPLSRNLNEQLVRNQIRDKALNKISPVSEIIFE